LKELLHTAARKASEQQSMDLKDRRVIKTGRAKTDALRLNKGRVLMDHRHESDQGSVANFGPATPRRTLVAVDLGGEQVSIEFKGSHFERDIILWGVRWYVTYPIRHRQLEEMMEERVWKLTTRH
jgi:hypothetical protein